MDSTGWGWLVQALVVITGWVVVHKLSAGRDFDKARRELVVKSVDAVIASVDSFFEDARSYHIKERDVSLEISLKMRLQDMAISIQGLGQLSHKSAFVTDCGRRIMQLRKAVSSRHFEDEHSLPIKDDDSQILEITDAILQLKMALVSLKRSQYLL